ncbi:MAG: radical SAM protein [Candidatus Aenigmatarchaeota archaeon]
MSHLEETVRRLKNFLNGKKEDPIKVDIFLTEACNFKCKFCNYSKSPIEVIRNEMNDKRILKTINEICEMEVKVCGILGGEPFMRKEILMKIMKKIKNKGIAGSIVTNGSLVKERDVVEIVRMEWDLIRVSIDGLKKTHEYLRGVKGSFDKAFRLVKSFSRVKRKLKSNFPTVEVNFVLTNRNYKELGKLMQLLSASDVNFVYVLPLIELTEESKLLKINEDEVKEVNMFLQEAKEIGKKFGVFSNLDEVIEKKLYLYSNKMEEIILDEDKKLPPCFLPWYTININSNGFVTPCAQWPKEGGIKLNEKSLKEIWYKDFDRVRNEILKKLPEWCSRCCVPLVDENKEIRRKLKE